MITTQQALDQFVNDHRIEIMAEALHAFALERDDDVWDSFVQDEWMCDFNVYQPDDSRQIFVVAYGLEFDEDGTIHIDTSLECAVGHVKLEE